ncbi:MAG: hypothetical protein E7544_00105 [Ruminococcaceae bacterium]|nr:hypothetical protein [Oscillospiraceae bacterium]
MKPQRNEQVYSLIHSQEMVQYMWKYSIHKQSTQIPLSVAFGEDIDFSLLARAVNIEIERNDCLRLRIFREAGRIRQFFLSEYKLDRILVKEFSSKQEQESFFDNDASKKLRVFDGETFRVVFFRTANEKSGIYLLVSHMIMDFAAAFTFFKDLIAVYDSLKNGTDMPKPLSKYEDIIIKEQDNKELEDRISKQYELLKEKILPDRRPVYNGISGQKILERQRKLLHNKSLDIPHVYLPFRDATHLVKCRLNDKDSNVISEYIRNNNLSPEWVIQLAFRIYLSKINLHHNDSLLWVLCPRRRTVKEKRCGGTLASPLPWREILDDNKTFIETARQLGETQAFLFRNSDVPFTAVRHMERELYDYSLLQTANSMMFSYLPSSEGSFGEREFDFTAYNFGRYVMPVYALTMQDSVSKRFSFSYIHRISLTTDEDVYRFHDGVVRTLIAAVSHNEKTIGEIIKEI